MIYLLTHHIDYFNPHRNPACDVDRVPGWRLTKNAPRTFAHAKENPARHMFQKVPFVQSWAFLWYGERTV